MIIKQPVWVSFESQRICSLRSTEQLFISGTWASLGPQPMPETWGAPDAEGPPRFFLQSSKCKSSGMPFVFPLAGAEVRKKAQICWLFSWEWQAVADIWCQNQELPVHLGPEVLNRGHVWEFLQFGLSQWEGFCLEVESWDPSKHPTVLRMPCHDDEQAANTNTSWVEYLFCKNIVEDCILQGCWEHWRFDGFPGRPWLSQRLGKPVVVSAE